MAASGEAQVSSEKGAPLPWNDPEYVRFVQALEGSTNLISDNGMGPIDQGVRASPSEVYQSLINRETRSLDTVDRVVNDARKTALASTQLIDMPVRALAVRAMSAAKSIMDDLVVASDFDDIQKALLLGDRKVFLGAVLIVVAIAAALVTSFSPARTQ